MKQNNNANYLTLREEIKTQCVALSVQRFVSCSGEENIVKKEGFFCETIPTVEPIDSQLK
jgi:hypothetical protein